MKFTTQSRYGLLSEHDVVVSAIEPILWELVNELRVEQFEQPDDEHTQVAVAAGAWSISVYVSGLVELENLETGDGSGWSRYLRDVPDRDLLELLVHLAQHDFQKVHAAGWCAFEDLPAYERDFYRSRL